MVCTLLVETQGSRNRPSVSNDPQRLKDDSIGSLRFLFHCLHLFTGEIAKSLKVSPQMKKKIEKGGLTVARQLFVSLYRLATHL